MRALTAGLSGQGRDEVERWLRVAEDGPDYGPLANGITSIRSVVAMVSSTYLSRGIADAEQAARLVLESRACRKRMAIRGPRTAGPGALPRRSRRRGARTARGGPDAPGRAASRDKRPRTGVPLAHRARGRRRRARRNFLARDALALADEIGHAASAAAANPHLALGCALMRGPDLHAAIEHLERAVELAGADESSYWHAHANIHLAAARHRLGDSSRRQRRALARPRRAG